MESKTGFSRENIIPGAIGVVSVAIIWIEKTVFHSQISDLEAVLIGDIVGLAMIASQKMLIMLSRKEVDKKTALD